MQQNFYCYIIVSIVVSTETFPSMVYLLTLNFFVDDIHFRNRTNRSAIFSGTVKLKPRRNFELLQ